VSKTDRHREWIGVEKTPLVSSLVAHEITARIEVLAASKPMVEMRSNSPDFALLVQALDDTVGVRVY
jgi:hypothetical protein